MESRRTKTLRHEQNSANLQSPASRSFCPEQETGQRRGGASLVCPGRRLMLSWLFLSLLMDQPSEKGGRRKLNSI